MCNPLLLSAGLSLLGSAMQSRAIQSASRRQDRALLAQIANQEPYRKRAQQISQDVVEQYAPQQREARQAEQEQQINRSLDTTLQSALNVEESPAGGAVSKEYTQRVAQGEASRREDAQRVARLMARTMAPTESRAREGYGLADASAALATQGNLAGGQAGVDQLQVQRAGTVNPWLYTAGTLLPVAGSLAGGYMGQPSAADTSYAAALANIRRQNAQLTKGV